MTSIDLRIRDAWNALDPMALHRAAEQLAGEGHEESAIVDALEKLLLEIRAAGGDDDTEERIMGVMDRLTEWCHQASHIRTTRTALPTKEEIANLPRWARVAFAARCARRVLAIHGYFRPVPEHRVFLQDPEWAVRVAEDSATGGRSRADARTGYDDAASGAYTDDNPRDEAAHNATNAAAYAAADAADNDRPARSWYAMNYALAASKPLSEIAGFIRRDFHLLTHAISKSHWNDATPVPPEVFGPLWPSGPPKGWPVEAEQPTLTDIALEVVSHDGLDERIVEDEVVNLFNAMNRYHIARGGQPLSLEDFQPLISALVPAGV